MFPRNSRMFREPAETATAGAGAAVETADEKLAKALADTTSTLVVVKDELKALRVRQDEEAVQRKREIDALAAGLRSKAGLPGYTKSGNPDKDFNIARAILGAHKGWQGETKQFPEYEMIHDYAPIGKAQVGDVQSAGGFLVPSTMMMEKFVEELLATPVAIAAGVDQLIGLTGGDVVIPGELGGISVTRGAEASTITETSEAYKDITLRRKQIQGLAGLSLSILRQTNNKAMQYVEKKLAAKVALRMDLDFFTGSGAENIPTGILNANGVQTVSWAGADFAGADQTATAKLEEHITKLKTANAYRGRPVWTCHPGTTAKFRGVLDSTGQPVFYKPIDLMGKDSALAANFVPSNGFAGSLYGHPLYETTQLTGSGVGSHLFFWNPADCAWALWDAIEIAVSEHVDFKSGKVAVRIIGWQDSLPYRGASVVAATSLTV